MRPTNMLPLRGERGLTLVEMLLAVALASIVMGSVAMLMTRIAKGLGRQSDVLATVSRTNEALGTIKGDLRRAGYRTIPQMRSAEDEVLAPFGTFAAGCDAPNGWGLPATFHSAILGDGDATDAPTGSMSSWSSEDSDQLTLVGAMRAGWSLPITTLTPDATTVEFRAPLLTREVLEREFADSLLAIQLRRGGVYLLEIDGGVQPTGRPGEFVVTLTEPFTPVADGNPDCEVAGLVNDDAELSAVQVIRYDVEEDANAENSFLLTRSLIGAEGEPEETTMVARNLTDFQIWFDGSSNEVTDRPVVEIDGLSVSSVSRLWSDDEGSMQNTGMNGDTDAESFRARYAYVQLSSRMSRPLEGTTALESGQTLRDRVATSDVFGDAVQYAAVVTVRAEVELTNYVQGNR